MYMGLDAYLKRISSTLEKVVAPSIEDDKIRGQVFAVISLLGQLDKRAELKSGLIREEVEKNCAMAKKIIDKMGEAGTAPLKELEEELSELESASDWDLKIRDRGENALSSAIRHFFTRKDDLPGEVAEEIDQMVREHLFSMSSKELGLTKPPDFDRISRSRREEPDGG